ncbi:MAG: L,D-transpeptidase [Methylococcales bacterium]|nr:L,D-transpeptidase [Methylococcales bacterium]MDP3840338.1 L,D-transpeptidase [Methylococcales bacterium]
MPKNTHPLRNSNYPNTYISEIHVSLDNPDHWVTLIWEGPQAAQGETGPFRSSAGAGLKGLNCNDVATSRKSGSKCTPKGSFIVSGFAARLNIDARAVLVTWFVRSRGIALHYFPYVPKYPASHGCVRLQSKHAAQCIYDNARTRVTKVIVSGTWVKPPKQW